MALIEKLGQIPDPRRGNAQRHELLDILAIALVASVCVAPRVASTSRSSPRTARRFCGNF